MKWTELMWATLLQGICLIASIITFCLGLNMENPNPDWVVHTLCLLILTTLFSIKKKLLGHIHRIVMSTLQSDYDKLRKDFDAHIKGNSKKKTIREMQEENMK